MFVGQLELVVLAATLRESLYAEPVSTQFDLASVAKAELTRPDPVSRAAYGRSGELLVELLVVKKVYFGA